MTSQNTDNLFTNLTLQQSYTTTLGTHIKNIYNRLTENEQQIQQHYMYPHPESNSSDNVQLLAPDFDPDIDQDSQPISKISTRDQPAERNIINAKDSEENNNPIHSSSQHSNWPDTPSVQIPAVSSTIPDEPPPSITLEKHSEKTEIPPQKHT